MAHHKIVFTGPVGAGKTTAIGAVSDIPPIQTEAAATDEGRAAKTRTTVAMDYGVIRLDHGERIHLYGTPGQERFDFMWRILCEGALGVVLLVSNETVDPLGELRKYLDLFAHFIAQTRLAVGVTNMDRCTTPGLDRYRLALAEANIVCPLFEVDARSKRDVSLLIQALLLTPDPAADTRATATRPPRTSRLS